MEQIDFSKITLKDTGIYSNTTIFSGLLAKNNITTVSQMLDDKLMLQIKLHCHQKTRKALDSFINLLKFKYLNIPLLNNKELIKKIELLNQTSSYPELSNKESINLYTLGLNHGQVAYLIHFIQEKIIKEQIDISDINLVDMLRKTIQDEHLNKIIKEIIILNIQSFDKNNTPTLDNLKSKLDQFKQNKNTLNDKISILEKEIQDLEKQNNKGGLKK